MAEDPFPAPVPVSAKRNSTEPRCSFIRDAQASLAQKYKLMARVTVLEDALSDILHHLASAHGYSKFNDPSCEEPECVLRAKRLLGWKLG